MVLVLDVRHKVYPMKPITIISFGERQMIGGHEPVFRPVQPTVVCYSAGAYVDLLTCDASFVLIGNSMPARHATITCTLYLHFLYFCCIELWSGMCCLISAI